MDQKSMVRQVFDFQKSTFDNFIESIATIQDQAEKSLSFFLDKNPWVPEESKNVILEWGNIYKKGRDDFKQIMDDGLDRMGSNVETAAEAAGQAAKRTAKSTEEAAKKASDERATDVAAKEALQRGAKSTDEAGKKASESMSKASQNLRKESNNL